MSSSRLSKIIILTFLFGAVVFLFCFIPCTFKDARGLVTACPMMIKFTKLLGFKLIKLKYKANKFQHTHVR